MTTSIFKGVYWNKTMSGWTAQYKSNTKTYYVGTFKSEKKAATMHNIHIALSNNIPENKKNDFYNKLGRPTTEEIEQYLNQQKHKINRNSSKKHASIYIGVSWNTQKQKWNCSIMKNKKHTYLGRFNTAEEAAEVYNKAAKLLTDKQLNVITTKNTYYPDNICDVKRMRADETYDSLRFSTKSVEMIDMLALNEDEILWSKELNQEILNNLECELNVNQESDDKFLQDIERIANNRKLNIYFL